MRIPYLRMVPQESTKQIGAFGGINKGLVTADHEFADMYNMSSDKFPAIATRKPRGEVLKTLKKPHGLFYKNGLIYVDGSEVYYKDQKIAEVQDNEKIIVGIGAYVVIFPDKIMYNTSSGELTQLEASWTQGTSARFELTTAGSTMVKVTCTGIGKAFRQFDGVEIRGCQNDSFNGSKVIQEISDNYIILIGSVETPFEQSSGLQIQRSVPDMDYVCESENRLWGCSSKHHEIYASKLGDPANWQSFEGISTDSYAVTVGSDGDFTGCISHLGYVLFFKEDTIHKVFGNKPSNYQVTTSTPMRGVAKGLESTMCIVNETLLYVSRDNICSYDGAQPDSVGDSIRDLGFREGVAGQYNGKYYASLRDSEGTWGLYVYDLTKQLWHKEDDLHLRDMIYGDGELYCVEADGKLFTISGERKERIFWMLESGDLLEGTVDFKHVKRLQLHFWMALNAEIDVKMKYEGLEDWQKISSYRARGYQTHTVNLIPKRCQKYRYRIEGQGEVALIAMTKKIGKGSDLHGCL